MRYITRISYNSSGWTRPTAEAREYEEEGSYNEQFGFGHEDWLFRDEWQMDGWRYAFLQGVNKSLARLQRENSPFDVRLFCVQPDLRRRFVADITNVEALSEDHAETALDFFKRNRWLTAMESEIRVVGGDPAALGRADYATHVLNIRYRLDDVHHFPADMYAEPGDPVFQLNRYILANIDRVATKYRHSPTRGAGRADPPSIAPIVRNHTAARVEISPAHALMQKRLMELLRDEYPRARIVREENCVDVSVRTDKQRIFFEIKSMLSPSAVIREALGQLLEYAFREDNDESTRDELVIVGRSPLGEAELRYFDWLTRRFQIPLSYRVVEI